MRHSLQRILDTPLVLGRFSGRIVTVLALLIVVFGSVLVPIVFNTSRLTQIAFLLIGLLLGVFGILIFLRYPDLGILAVVAGSVFVPFQGPGGINVAVLGSAGLFAFWLFKSFFLEKRLLFASASIVRPVLFFTMVCLIAFSAGQIRWFLFAGQAPIDAQVGGLMIYLLGPLSLLVVPYLVREERALQRILWAVLLLGAVYIVSRVFLINPVLRLFAAGSTGSLFWVWMAAMSGGQLLFNQELSSRKRWMLGLFLALLFYSAYIQGSDWKSGWVPPAMAVGVLFSLRFRKTAVFLAPIGAAVGVYLALGLIETDQYSWGTRVDAWVILWGIIQVSPVIGLGFANYYWYTPLFPIRGYYVQFSSHNQYVDIFAQAGVMGLTAFFWLIGALVMLAVSLGRRAAEGFPRGYVYGAIAGIAGTLAAGFLGDWILPFVYNVGMAGFRASLLGWVLLGGLVALDNIYAGNPGRTKPQ